VSAQGQEKVVSVSPKTRVNLGVILTQFQVGLGLERVDDIIEVELLCEVLCGAAILRMTNVR